MKLFRREIELLSPAGTFEALVAAAQAKANAVYFGVKQLNMRSGSSHNFTMAELPGIVNFCKKNNLKSYLTVNTVLYDKDLSTMRSIVDRAKAENITAVIVSDISAIQYARSIGMPVHISTQLNISNIEAVRFFAQFADVMILARELSLQQVNEISYQIREENITGPGGNLIKIELFAHGALCMSISGKCYLSLHEHKVSANRGVCRQDCRKAYIVTDKETGTQLEIDNEYIMSPKDLCTIGFVNKLLDAGVRVFKIEGRARSPEYVKTTTGCYNEAISACLNGTYNRENIDKWKTRLSTVFNRGFWDGYYLGQRLGEWSENYGSNATKRKIYLGRGINYFSQLKVAEFLLESGELCVGNEILITGPTTGVIRTFVKEIRVNFQNVKKTIKGDHFSIPLDQKIRRSDKLYKIVKTTKNLLQ